MPENIQPSAIPFKAETRQILEILIHSLYNEREVFLRELISNASDALTRMNFEMLTNRNVLDADTELKITITADPENRTLTIKDTGIGMTEAELIENLGTIAQSGARNFIKAVEEGQQKVSDIIGQFGVGFYSAFMIADIHSGLSPDLTSQRQMLPHGFPLEKILSLLNLPIKKIVEPK